MRSMNFDQQDNIFAPEMAKPVTVMGVGSVGSQVVLSLARLGFTELTVWDGDSVASHNIPMSVYRVKDLCRPKVDALTEIVDEAMGVHITAHNAMYTCTALRTYVVSCVDSMDVRRRIWREVKQNPFVPLFVDTRLVGEFVSVFAIRPCAPEDIKYYEAYLYASADAMLPQCGYHNAIHISGTAANAAVAALTEWLKCGTTKRHLEMLCGHFQMV